MLILIKAAIDTRQAASSGEGCGTRKCNAAQLMHFVSWGTGARGTGRRERGDMLCVRCLLLANQRAVRGRSVLCIVVVSYAQQGRGVVKGGTLDTRVGNSVVAATGHMRLSVPQRSLRLLCPR